MAEITPGHLHSKPKTQSLKSSFQLGCHGTTLPRTHLNPQPKLQGQLKPERSGGLRESESPGAWGLTGEGGSISESPGRGWGGEKMQAGRMGDQRPHPDPERQPCLWGPEPLPASLKAPLC